MASRFADGRSTAFDVGSIQYEAYSSSMKHWLVEIERPAIAKHIHACATKSAGQNSLWRHFGAQRAAEDLKLQPSRDDVLQLVLDEVQGLKREAKRGARFRFGTSEAAAPAVFPPGRRLGCSDIAETAAFILEEYGLGNRQIALTGPNVVTVNLSDVPPSVIHKVFTEFGRFGLRLNSDREPS